MSLSQDHRGTLEVEETVYGAVCLLIEVVRRRSIEEVVALSKWEGTLAEIQNVDRALHVKLVRTAARGVLEDNTGSNEEETRTRVGRRAAVETSLIPAPQDPALATGAKLLVNVLNVYPESEVLQMAKVQAGTPTCMVPSA